MFAEELTTNAAKKRQEEAKKRRLEQQRLKKLKQKQQAEAAAAAAAAAAVAATEQQHAASTSSSSTLIDEGTKKASSSPTVTTATTTTSTSNSNDGMNRISSKSSDNDTTTKATASTTTIANGTTGGSNGSPLYYRTILSALESGGKSSNHLSAVEQAKQARMYRDQLKVCHTHAILLQAHIRSYMARTKWYQTLGEQYDDELRATFIHNNETTKPTATTTKTTTSAPMVRMLTTKCLCLYRYDSSIPQQPPKQNKDKHTNHHHEKRLALLLQYVILPNLKLMANCNGGTSDNDDDEDLFLCLWMETKEGQWRLRLLLQTCLDCVLTLSYSTKNDDDDSNTLFVSNVCTLFRYCLGLKQNSSSSNDTNGNNNNNNTTKSQHHNRNYQLLVQLTQRHFLLFNSGSSSSKSSSSILLLTVRNYLMYGLGGRRHEGKTTGLPNIQSFGDGDGLSVKEVNSHWCTSDEKICGSYMFQLMVDSIRSLQQHSNTALYTQMGCSFVTYILTIPLLECKLTPQCFNDFITTTDSSSSSSLLIQFLQTFWDSCRYILNNFDENQDIVVHTIFHSSEDTHVNLRQCPCPSELALYSNLVSWFPIVCLRGGIDSATNKTKNFQLLVEQSNNIVSLKDVTLYYTVLTSLLPLIPLSIYQSSSSSGGTGSPNVAVTWERGGTAAAAGSTNCTPIIIHPLIVQQCQSIVSTTSTEFDLVYRQLIEYSLNEVVNVVFGGNHSNNEEDPLDAFLTMKSDKDLEDEMELDKVSTQTTKSLAAQEARARDPNFFDESKKAFMGFWNRRGTLGGTGSGMTKWANKMSKGMSSLFMGGSSDENERTSKSGEGKLLNTSSASRDLASGNRKISASSLSKKVVASKKQTSDSSLLMKQPAAVAATTTATTSSNNSTTTTIKKREPPHVYMNLGMSILRWYATFFARWGGYSAGTTTISSTSKSPTSMTTVSLKAEPTALKLLNVLCFSNTRILQVCWALLQHHSTNSSSSIGGYKSYLKQLVSSTDDSSGSTIKSIPIVTSLVAGTTTTSDNNQRGRGRDSSTSTLSLLLRQSDTGILLFLSSICLSHTLVVTDDNEIFELSRPIPQHQLRRYISVVKQICYRTLWLDEKQQHSNSSNKRRGGDFVEQHYFGIALANSCIRTLKDLHNRSCRRLLCAPSLFVVDETGTVLQQEMSKCKTFDDYSILLKNMVLLQRCPFVIPFKKRLKLFERIVTTNRIAIQGSNELHNLKPGITVRIMRGRVLEDGLQHLNKLPPNHLRQRIVVQYYNQAGTTETGLDVGGLFKEFWFDLCELAFDPNYALFKVTEDNTTQSLYPNPMSAKAHGNETHRILFQFLGRILGKALYEGITIQPQFAHFFLAFLRGDYNFQHLLSDLITMDPQLYQNIMFLKHYTEGDIADLALTFTVTTDDFGTVDEIPLIANGSNIAVTNDNKQRYIQCIAKYHLYDSLKVQSEAFCQGLWDVIDRRWLQMFNPNELQVLISGSNDVHTKLDIGDMKSHTRYVGGFTPFDTTVRRFWNIVEYKLSAKEQRLLLKFVTSCDRPPPLGFSSMNPPFTLQRISDSTKLPSASTCFNTLKLPVYASEKILKERLLYSITSGAGFELT